MGAPLHSDRRGNGAQLSTGESAELSCLHSDNLLKADAFGRGICLVDPGASPAGAVITGLGLISFNRTINRLRKPVALLLISRVGAAAVLSYHPCRTAGRRSAGGEPVRLGQRRQLRVADGFRGGSPGRRDALW